MSYEPNTSSFTRIVWLTPVAHESQFQVSQNYPQSEHTKVFIEINFNSLFLIFFILNHIFWETKSQEKKRENWIAKQYKMFDNDYYYYISSFTVDADSFLCFIISSVVIFFFLSSLLYLYQMICFYFHVILFFSIVYKVCLSENPNNGKSKNWCRSMDEI